MPRLGVSGRDSSEPQPPNFEDGHFVRGKSPTSRRLFEWLHGCREAPCDEYVMPEVRGSYGGLRKVILYQ